MNNYGCIVREEVRGRLYSSSRPGYDRGRSVPIAAEVVVEWIGAVKSQGVKSIVCLLNEHHLKLYEAMPSGLLQTYRDAGLEVRHVPVVDHQRPPLSAEELAAVEQHFEELSKPMLIHCSAGIDRTGAAVRHLKSRMA